MGGISMPVAAEKPEVIGAGYLYHCVPEFSDYHQRLLACGGRIDIMEYLISHFASDPEYLGEVNDSMGAPPSSLHSFEYMIGSVDRPPEPVVKRLQQMVEISNCQYIGEHVGVMGTSEVYTGTFLQPPGTDEQTEQFIKNLIDLRDVAGC